MCSRNKQKELLQSLASKTKEELIQEYSSYDEATARDIWLAIFEELQNAVISSNIQLLNSLSKLIDCININKLTLQSYYNYSDNILKNTNLVILASKHNAPKSLQYLFDNSNFLKKIHYTLSPCDEDEVRHNAFYYAIRLNNITILQILIGEWPGINSQEIDEVLSQAYAELKLKNVALSNEMEQYVVDTLINLRFYTDDSADRKNVEITVDIIQERIDLLLENINLINAEYLNVEIDEKFLYIAKFIAKNIHFLKRYLKSTYDRLPWEEIEFCLIIFINSCTKQEEINVLYKSVLTKENILCYLCNFALILKDVKVFIENVNVNNLRKLPNIKRNNIIASIIKNNPSFKALYDSYTEIIDVYSLNQIKFYTELAISANCTKKEEQFIIIRALQVIGEFMKNTLESPKLSNATSEILLRSLRNDTKKIVTNLRNSLSHSNSFYKITQIQTNTEISFFTNIQDDIKKINAAITEILYKLKLKRLETILKIIVDSSCLNEIREAGEVFKFINYDAMLLQIKVPENYREIEELIDKLKEKMDDKTSCEIELFNEITEIIKIQKAKWKVIPKNYLSGLDLLKECSNETEFNGIKALKSLANKMLECISLQNESHNFKDIAKILQIIFTNINTRKKLDLNDDLTWELVSFFEKVIYAVDFDMERIKWIETLRDKLKCVDNSKSNCAEKEEMIVTDEDFNEQLTIKLSLLENIVNQNSKKLNYKKIQTMLEMLLLDIMSILGNYKNCLKENLLYLDNNMPLLTGKNLRDHLAHGNTLTDILSVNPTTTILSNVIKLTKDKVTQITRGIGKIMPYDSMKLKRIHNHNLMTTTIQRKMFAAIAEGNFKEVKISIENGADVKGRTTNLWTSLHFAAMQSNLEILTFLLNQNLNIDSKDMKQQSALHIAAINGNKVFIEFFLKKQKVDDPDYNGKTLLHLAAENGHKTLIKFLCKNNASTIIKDSNGFSPLHYAIFKGHTDTARMLIKKEQNVEINQTENGCTALHIASKNGHIEIVNFLLQKKANVNAKNNKDIIPLHQAAQHGHLEVVKVLILKGSDINAKTESGSTPLHYAVENNHEKIVELLIEHGADINVINELHLNTALSYAADHGYIRIVEILLKNKANVNIYRMTPLHLAASKGHLDIVSLLLQSKAKINRKNIDGCTALHLSANNGHKDVVIFLLKNKSNLNVRDKNKRTPIHAAVSGGHKEIVKLLLSEGADANSEATHGFTPLHICATSGNEVIAKILIEEGANTNVRNFFDKTPLLLAISNDFSGVVEILLAGGANICCFGDINFSALHAAASYGSKKVTEILLNNKNININDKTENNYTPLHIAVDSNNIDIAKILIQKKCDIDATCARNQTPLCLAAQINKEMVQLLLANGAKINFRNAMPLKLALVAGHKDIVKTLLGYKKLNLKFKDSDNYTFLHFAALYGDRYLAEVLLKRGIIDVDAVETNDNDTPLLIAALKNHKDVVEVLLANNANVNVVSKAGDTSLHRAVRICGTDVINLLLKAGASTNIRNKKNRLPIEVAVAIGHLSIVQILLEFMDVNIIGNDGWTMLHLAAQRGHLEVAKFLIEKGANINARSEKGLKPIHIAVIKGYKNIIEYLFNTTDSLNDCDTSARNLLHYAAMGGQLEIVKYLIDKKFDINLPDLFGSTPLYFAASQGSKEVVKILLNNGANYKSVFNKKPMEAISDQDVITLLTITDRLYEAVKNNNILNVKSWINKGAILNSKNSDNVTPLHQASCKGYETVVEILLKHEANANLPGKGGCTPLHYAANFGHTGIVQKLLSHGAIYNIKSDKNKTPLDLAKHQSTIDLLKLVDKSFTSVQNGNSKIIDELNKVKDIPMAQAVMNACNKENKTIIVSAIQNGFPKIMQLKDVFLGKDEAAYIVKAQYMKTKEEYEEAINIHKIILEKRRKIFGPNDPVILDIQDEIACLLYNQQKHTKSLKLYEETYDKRQKILGVNNKDTLITRSKIALTLHRLGQCNEALTIFEEVLKRQTNLLGPNNIEVLTTQTHMAIVLDELGRYDEALETNYRNYEKYKETFGIHHPSTLISQSNIATSLSKQGKHNEALKLYENIYETMKIIFGPTHSDTLNNLHNIGAILITQEKFDEALKLYHMLYNLQKLSVGLWHPNALRTRLIIADILTGQNKFYAAMKIFYESLEQGRTILGAKHSCILNSLNNLEKIKNLYPIDRPESLRMCEYLDLDINKAASDGDLNIIETLLINGEDVNTVDSEGRTPLHLSCSNNHMHIILLLLQHDADVTCKTNKGNTPLHITTSKGNKEITKVLLNHSKQTNNKQLINFIDATTNTGGSTALHVAVKGNFEEVVKILLEYGAAYNFTDNNNKAPSDFCTGKNLTDLFKLIDELFKDAKNGNQSIINKLQAIKHDDYIAIMNTRNKQGNTLLQVAMVNKHKDVVSKLLELLKA